MRSRSGPHALASVAAFALVVVLGEGPVRAAPSAPYKIVFRDDSTESRGLLGRLRGHLVDTPIQVLEEPAPLERDLDDQLQAARVLGRSRDVDAVVWYRRDSSGTDGEFVVAVFVPTRARARRSRST